MKAEIKDIKFVPFKNFNIYNTYGSKILGISGNTITKPFRIQAYVTGMGSEYFDNTEEGYILAQEWLLKKRIEVLKKLGVEVIEE